MCTLETQLLLGSRKCFKKLSQHSKAIFLRLSRIFLGTVSYIEKTVSVLHENLKVTCETLQFNLHVSNAEGLQIYSLHGNLQSGIRFSKTHWTLMTRFYGTRKPEDLVLLLRLDFSF